MVVLCLIAFDTDSMGDMAAKAVITAEHYKPLLYVLTAVADEDPVEFSNDGFAHGSFSMLCVRPG